jgi:hypothetical protein
MQTCITKTDAYRNTVYCALGHIARGSKVLYPRAASARAPCLCPPRRRPPTLWRRRTSRPSCARFEPARGSRERALSPRKRQASECTRVRRAEHRSEGRRSRGVWNVRAKASARARRARAPRVRHGRGSRRRTELGYTCVAMVVARGTCALRRRTSRPSCAHSEPQARKPRARSQPTRA